MANVDLSKAEEGRKKMDLATADMPGTAFYLSELGSSKPLSGAKITACTDINSSSALFVEALVHLGAEVQWCSVNTVATTPRSAAVVAAVVAANPSSVRAFLCGAADLVEHWRCIDRALDWGPTGPDLIVDDLGDVAYLLRNALLAEDEFERRGSEETPPPPANCHCLMTHVIHLVFADSLSRDPSRYRRICANLIGISENSPNITMMAEHSGIPFPMMDVGAARMASSSERLDECQRDLIRSLTRASGGGGIANKSALVHGFDDVAKLCIDALSPAVAVLFITDHPNMGPNSHSLRIEDVVDKADFVVTTKDVGVGHMNMMRDRAVLYNAGGRVDMEGLKAYPLATKTGEETWTFANTGARIVIVNEGRLANSSFAMIQPKVIVSCALTLNLIALLEMWAERATGKYKEKKISEFPADAVEKVAAIHMIDLQTRNPLLRE